MFPQLSLLPNRTPPFPTHYYLGPPHHNHQPIYSVTHTYPSFPHTSTALHQTSYLSHTHTLTDPLFLKTATAFHRMSSLMHHLSPTYCIFVFPSLHIFHSPLTFHFTLQSSSTFCHSCFTSRSLPSRTLSSVCLYELSRTCFLASCVLRYINYTVSSFLSIL